MTAFQIKKKLIHPGSTDTFENRQAVKAMLGSLNIKTRNLHRAGARRITVSPRRVLVRAGLIIHLKPTEPEPDRGPKNNFTESLSETNKDIAEWMFEADIALTPEQARAIVTGQQGRSTTFGVICFDSA